MTIFIAIKKKIIRTVSIVHAVSIGGPLTTLVGILRIIWHTQYINFSRPYRILLWSLWYTQYTNFWRHGKNSTWRILYTQYTNFSSTFALV